jgi:hypothetical protein
MYRSSTDRQNFTARSGSHATKARATGRIDDVPAWAAKVERNLLTDQYKLLQQQLANVAAGLDKIRAELKLPLKREEVVKLEASREELRRLHRLLEQQADTFKSLAKAATASSWSTAFYYVAQQILDPADFYKLVEETDAITGKTND